MLKKPKITLAAIDIGSNAIRMVIAEKVSHGLEVKKKYRFPIRLGADVFEKGQISGKNLKESARTFQKFSEVCQEQQVTLLKAVGTSALREAKNQKSFIELIHRKSGIKVEVIDGILEANLIHLAINKEVHLQDTKALLIDIGGGSVEFTHCEGQKVLGAQSFPIGTVRTLEQMKKRKLSEAQLGVLISEYLNSITQFIHPRSVPKVFDMAIGTGGNLEALGKLKPILLKSNHRSSMTLNELSEVIHKISRLSVKERIEKLKMRPDRADVILPAAMIIQAAMRQAGTEKLLIPHVGLKDGLLWSMLDSLSLKT